MQNGAHAFDVLHYRLRVVAFHFEVGNLAPIDDALSFRVNRDRFVNSGNSHKGRRYIRLIPNDLLLELEAQIGENRVPAVEGRAASEYHDEAVLFEDALHVPEERLPVELTFELLILQIEVRRVGQHDVHTSVGDALHPLDTVFVI